MTDWAGRTATLHEEQLPQKDNLCGAFWGAIVLRAAGFDHVDQDLVALESGTLLPAGGPFLVGSGGANDVASRAAECLVITRSGPARLPEQAAYITSPGDRVQTVVTDLGILRKRDGDLCLSAVGAGESPLEERVRAAVAGCGWDVTVDRTVEELPPPMMPEVLALRRYDPRGWFLR